MKRLQLTVAATLLLAVACGGNGDAPAPDDTASSSASTDVAARPVGTVVVESPDGIASIEIDPSSLPDGVSINDVAIIAAINDTDDTSLPLVAVRLEPHGTVLSAPATVQMTIPGPPLIGIVTIHQSGNYIQFVESTIDLVGENTVIATELTSFSVLANYGFVSVTASLGLAPNPVTVFQQQTAIATYATGTESATLTLVVDAGLAGVEARQYTMSSPLPPGAILDFVWSMVDGVWDPKDARLIHDSTARNADRTLSATSVCIKENMTDVTLGINSIFAVRLEGVEQVADVLPSFFSELFDTETGDQLIDVDDNNWHDLVDARVGDVFEASATTKIVLSSSCINATTATAPPVLEGTEAAQPTSLNPRADGTVAIDFAGDFESLLKSGEFDSVVLEFHSSDGPEVTSLRLTHDKATGETAATVSQNGLPLDGHGTFEFFAGGSAVFLGWSEGALVREGGFNEVQVHITEEPGGEIFTLVLKGES